VAIGAETDHGGREDDYAATKVISTYFSVQSGDGTIALYFPFRLAGRLTILMLVKACPGRSHE
jgi:hypothetical protein